MAIPKVPRIPVPRRRDAGAVTVLVSILLGGGVLLPMGALVVDVGSIYVESEELQTGADAAAMAVAKECAAGHCTTAELATQLTTATQHAGINAKDGHATVSELCGRWANLPACSTPATSRLSTCVGTPPAGDYVEVRVRTQTAEGGTMLPPVFAKTLVGNETYDGTAVGSCARVAATDLCVTADKATYTHTFDGPAGVATIKADRALCSGQEQPFTLVSYTAPAASFAVPQYLYDVETKSITSSTRSLSFKVDVPACYTQVDFVFGSEAVNPLTYAAYGDKKVGSGGPPGNRSVGPPAWYNGGTRACDPRPTVTATSMANRTLQLKLASRSGANVDAVFTVTAGGKSTIHRVTKGSSKTVTIPAAEAGNVQVQDSVVDGSEFKWTTYRWVAP